MPNQLFEAFAELRRAGIAVPKQPRLPTAAEVDEVASQIDVPLPTDLRRFLLEASDVVVGTLEPATATSPESHRYLPRVVESGRAYGVPSKLLPFCENNADFYCFDDRERIVYWSHNGAVDESWPNLATWIRKVWLGRG